MFAYLTSALIAPSMHCFLGTVTLALAREDYLLLADIDVDRATRTLSGK